MADPTMHELIAYGGSGLAVALSSWKWLAERNVKALDKSIEDIGKSMADLKKSVQDSVAELGREIRHLRETDIGQAKDIGALQEGQRALERRIEGQSTFYREEMAKLARAKGRKP